MLQQPDRSHSISVSYHLPNTPHQPSSSTNTTANAAYFEKRNALFDVGSEFMREAGYTMPIHRLISSAKAVAHQQNRYPNTERSLSIDDAGIPASDQTDAENPSDLHLLSSVPSKCADDHVHKIAETVIDDLDQSDQKGKSEKRPKSSEWLPHQLLKEKRRLMSRRTRACDCSLIFAAIGIILIVIDAEFTAAGRIEQDSISSVVIQCLAVISTMILLYLVLYYHFTDLRIAAIDSGTFDWRVGLTWDRMLQCSAEFFVCAICPVPGGLQFNWVILLNTTYAESFPVRLDAVLSIPMFLRFYLICRFIVLHSRQFQDAATRSIASLNYITMNFQFVFRTLIDENPLVVMVVFSVFFCVLMAWILTQCDRYTSVPVNKYYLNALWFVVVTYISIGYGDVIPASYCARALAIFTGIVGKTVSSVLIAIMSRQMELSRGELHVHNFVSDSKLCKERKHAAARVLQHIWFIHRCRRQGLIAEGKLRQHQRHFLAAIAEFRRIKWEQRRLAEAANNFTELAIAQKEMSETVWTLQRSQRVLASQIDLLTIRLHEVTLLAYRMQAMNSTETDIDERLQLKLAAIEMGDKNA